MTPTIPTGADIEEKWAGIIEGRLSREEVHAWAHPLMLAEEASHDLMVMSAIQYLDGFDMTSDSESRFVRHGPPGEYVRSASEVADEFERWRAECVDYDADPEDWSHRRLEVARRYIANERRRSRS